MGLSQKIKFSFSDRSEVQACIAEVFEKQKVIKDKDQYIITPVGSNSYKIEICIEDYGIFIHRSGQYFEVVGKLIEGITGRFKKATIEDY